MIKAGTVLGDDGTQLSNSLTHFLTTYREENIVFQDTSPVVLLYVLTKSLVFRKEGAS